jgi:hypothetical protein
MNEEVNSTLHDVKIPSDIKLLLYNFYIRDTEQTTSIDGRSVVSR